MDGALISDYPTKLIAEGRFAQVPLIAGCVGLKFMTRITAYFLSIRATSNETGGGTDNLTAVLHPAYPLLTPAELAEFNKVYFSFPPLSLHEISIIF